MVWTVVGTLRNWAAAKPDAVMLIDANGTATPETRTWGETDRRTSRLANALRAAGVGAGDRIAFIDKNGFAYFDVLFGGGKINAVNVAVNWRLAAPEMAQIINDAQAKILFVGPDFYDHLDRFAPDLETVTRIVLLGPAHGDHQELDAFLAAHADTDPGVEPAGGDVAMQLYTSGTTGLPKGVMLTNDNLGALLDEASHEFGMSEVSVSMVAMPLFHIGGSGWALVGLGLGSQTAIVREVDPALVLRAVEASRITHGFVVPAVLQFMLMVPDVGDRDLSSLHTIAYGASPISEEVLRRCLDVFGCRFVQLYGLTETTGAITVLRPDDHQPGGPRPERLRSCGQPFRHIALRIVDPETGADRPTGAVGEIWTRSRQNMLGYWRKPDETARTIDADGWLRTGDAGYLDGDGYVYLHDRIKDMIVTGGENVYPAEVENVLMSHPSVADVAVIGVPSERWGETVKAVVVLAGGGDVDADALLAFCRDRLAHFKCPTSVDAIDALPRNPSGKILKRELRAPYWEGHNRNIS
ncbi:MAG: fatty acid--CoA ligase [Acidimicrobiales bacterium]